MWLMLVVGNAWAWKVHSSLPGINGAFVGDVDGDGYGDVVVGDPTYTHTKTDEGRLKLYSGGPSHVASSPVWSANGGVGFASLGALVSAAGDVDGDGYADFFASAPSDGSSPPTVELFLGSPSGPGSTADWTLTTYAEASALVALGDVDGDGYDDVAIGEYQAYGSTYLNGVVEVFYGSASGLAASADLTIWGATSGWEGHSVAAGDVDGDGSPDLVSFAPGSGTISVRYGGSSRLASTADWTWSDAKAFPGWSGACVVDVNGDGYDDVVASDGDAKLATVDVFYGSAAGLGASPDAAWHSAPFQRFTCGDANGDGKADLASGDENFGGGRGRIQFWSGGDAKLGFAPSASHELFGMNGDGLGWTLSAWPDADGDGDDELLLGGSVLLMALP